MLWQQLGAAIDMLENAIRACPASTWGRRVHPSEFWYIAYHSLFFLDYYLSESDQGFTPPAPFTLGELDPAGVLPDRVYSQAELAAYLQHARKKARTRLAALTEQKAREHCGFAGRDRSVMEMHMYNLRHVQHHAAQLYLLLRQATNSAPDWISVARQAL
jgi:hypothetical protein